MESRTDGVAKKKSGHNPDNLVIPEFTQHVWGSSHKNQKPAQNLQELKLENINQYIKSIIQGDIPKSAELKNKVKNEAMF